MSNQRLSLVAPNTVNRTVAPTRQPNAVYLEYLTDAEVAKLKEAASPIAMGTRTPPWSFVTYSHGLRASELTDLQMGSG